VSLSLSLSPGASGGGTVELLPAPSSATNWTLGLPTDNGHDSDQVFEFNGTQAVKVPEGLVSTSLKEPFTVSVWMRHGPGARDKETVLCNSDKTGTKNTPNNSVKCKYYQSFKMIIFRQSWEKSSIYCRYRD